MSREEFDITEGELEFYKCDEPRIGAPFKIKIEDDKVWQEILSNATGKIFVRVCETGRYEEQSTNNNEEALSTIYDEHQNESDYHHPSSNANAAVAAYTM